MTFSAPYLAGAQVLTISVMITTRNRVADLRSTCRVLRQADPAPLEILITSFTPGVAFALVASKLATLPPKTGHRATTA